MASKWPVSCSDCGSPDRVARSPRCRKCIHERVNAKAREYGAARRARGRCIYDCVDCSQPLIGADNRTLYCTACKKQRVLLWHSKWNASHAAKLSKMKYLERHEDRLKTEYAAIAATRSPKYVTCATLLCENKVLRIKGSRAKFCLSCAAVFMSPWYVARRAEAAIRRGKIWRSHQWRKAS